MVPCSKYGQQRYEDQIMGWHAKPETIEFYAMTLNLHTLQHFPFPPRQTTQHQLSIPPASQTSGSYPHKDFKLRNLETTFAISLHIPKPPIIIIKPSPPSHHPTAPNAQLKPSPLTARVPTDFNPCAADLAKPLVAQIRLRVSAARTEPF